jgi:hypothetical protein
VPENPLNYYFADATGTQRGPVPAEQLVSNGVTSETLVWADGMPNWVRADSLPDLRPYFSQPAPFQNPAYTSFNQPLGYSTAANSSNGMGIASMILGICSIALTCVWFLGVPAGIVGLILGIISRSSAKTRNIPTAASTAGIICSSIGLALDLVFVVVFLFIAVKGH